MAATNKDELTKTMDVSKGGKILPDTSARPVLVTHRPMIQDPMVKPVEDSDETVKKNESQKLSIPTHAAKVIQPVNGSEEVKSNNSDTEPEAASAAADTSDAEAVVDAVVEQAGSKSKEGGTDKEDKALEEHVQKLIADKTYFVPIGEAAQQRNNRAIVMLVVFLLFLGAGYFILDAQVIKNDIKLPYEFIKSSPKIEPAEPVATKNTQLPVANDPYTGWATFTAPKQNFSLRYPKDWKLAAVGTGTTITSPTGMEINYSPLESGVVTEAPEVTSCGTQSSCGVDVVYSIEKLAIPNKDNVSLVKIGTDTAINEGIYLQAAGSYSMELHTPASAKSTPVKGPNKLGQGKDGYMISYKIRAQNKDWLVLRAIFPASYKTKTPQQAFSSTDAAAAEKILKSLRFKSK